MSVENPAGANGAVSLDAVQLARLMQFGDSALPVGAFSFSLGLESAVQQKIVTDAATLREFVQSSIRQAASGDGVGLIFAHRAASALDVNKLLQIDHAVFNRKLSESTREMTVRTGKKLAEIALRVVKAPLLDEWLEQIKSRTARGTYPVCLAALFASLGLDARTTFVVHQNGIATAMLGAALRLMKVSHLETQAILYEINATMDDAYRQAAGMRLEDMSGFAPLIDIFSAVHAKSHVRLFMN